MSSGICFRSGSGMIGGILCAAFLVAPGRVLAQQLTENFSTADHADFGASTGLWNTVQHAAQAGAVSNATASQPISFGDGSDGVLSSSDGYDFDTDAHPNGYSFVSVSITGGAVTIHGTHPLVIRSLTSVNIAPLMDVSGPSGGPGQQTGLGSLSGPQGGVARAGHGNGGYGGAVAGNAAAMNGGQALDYQGNPDAGSPGIGSSTAGTQGNDGSTGAGGPNSAAFDTAFYYGAGGGGGGGHGASGDAIHATGGAGGAGGGAIHIAAIGAITVGAINAAGGNGGASAASSSSCSGVGAGANGGAVWLQSLTSIDSGGSVPNVAAGGNGAPPATCITVNGALAGEARADAPAPGPAGWGASYVYSTVNAAPSTTYSVQSKGYDLETFNAVFSSAPTLTTVLNGGTITAMYAASADNVNFTPFTSSITSLGGLGYRYLKFQLTITTGGAAAASPELTQIMIPYSEGGVNSVNLGLAAGCGSLKVLGDGSRRSPEGPPKGLWFWIGAMMIAWAPVRARVRHQST